MADPEQLATADAELEASVQALELKHPDTEEIMTCSAFAAMPEARLAVMATAFSELREGNPVIAIVAKDESEETTSEFTAVLKDGALEVLVASCQITFADLQPSECIEYCFGEADDEWMMVQLSRDALDTYRNMKFEAWKQMLLHPTCEAAFRRMLQIGVIVDLYDQHLFSTPENMKSLYQVQDEKSGKLIDLPHPVGGLRVWNAELQQYDCIETHLGGAPAVEDKEQWWAEFVDSLKREHGAEYVDGLLQG